MEFSLDSLQPKERASFALRALYEAAGCRKYHMGRFEEYGLYQENRSFLSSEQVITFTDLDGRLLALKPDVTLSIAKTAQPAPGETLRYYYHENVYRPSAESHTFQEISQMGLEMLGAVGKHRCSRRSGWQRRAWPSWGPRGCWKSATWAICSACSTHWACRRMPPRPAGKAAGKECARAALRCAGRRAGCRRGRCPDRPAGAFRQLWGDAGKGRACLPQRPDARRRR